MKKETIRNITITAILVAIEIIFQFIGNYITIGQVSINLTLIPITIGAIMAGPFSGVVLGIVNGILVLFAPSTNALFIPLNPIGTIILCLSKCSFAGLLAGLTAKSFKNKESYLASLSASIIVPIVNTSLFVVACFTIFKPFLESNLLEYENEIMFLLLGVLGWNFIFEIVSNIVLTPIVIKAISKIRK